MPYDLKNKLVIAISSRALFDLEEENKIFEEKGLKAYINHQIKYKNKILKKGTGFRLVKNLLRLNELQENMVEVVILSRNNCSISLRITKSLEKHGLDISRSAWTSGTAISNYLKPFDVDLFLSANEEDVKEAIKSKIAAAKIYPNTYKDENNLLKIAFDGDAVLFSDESEKIYKEKGLEAFLENEKLNAKKPLPKGPFAKLLKLLSNLQNIFEEEIIRIALITARNSPAHERVIRTLKSWDVNIDEAFFLGGVEKSGVVKAFGADIFFDDQYIHLDETSKENPVAKVPRDE